MNKSVHYWEPLTAENSPSDPWHDGGGLDFKTLEHNQWNCPMAIRITDPDGRSLTYVPIQVGGVAVKSDHYLKVSDLTDDQFRDSSAMDTRDLRDRHKGANQ